VPVKKDAAETVTSASSVSNPQPSLYAQALAAIDGLGKREARKLCSPLSIQQKRNGVELSTELMIASIKREFKTDPERVIEAIRDRLPDRLPATADPIQLAS
jgi:ribosomal protein S13